MVHLFDLALIGGWGHEEQEEGDIVGSGEEDGSNDKEGVGVGK